jgi:putative aminopeptidase FrvX
MVSVPLPEPAPRPRYSGALPFPERSAAVGVGVRNPHTPAEIVSVDEVARVEELLAVYLGVTIGRAPRAMGTRSPAGASAKELSRPGEILRSLVETYGVSGYEEPVAGVVRKQLPPWAQEWAAEDSAGNLFVAFGRNSDKPSLVFVAHMDEIGWVVKEITEGGRLSLASRGSFLDEHFLGHLMLVHTAGGPVPATLEIPEDYRGQGYKPARSRTYTAWTGASSAEEVARLGIRVGDSVTVPKRFRQLAGTRINGRSFDDRVGSTALVAALWELDPATVDREVIFVWAVEEEIGLDGAKVFAARAAAEGGVPDFVFAVDTFVSGDSPLESPRFAQGRLGEGFVVRAVDNSNVAPRPWVDRVVEIARRNNIPVQYGITGGGNDGAAFVPYGSVDIPIGWPLRYSHSVGEVADLKDIEALGRIVAALVKEF